MQQPLWDMNEERINAIGRFDRELRGLTIPTTQTDLRAVTGRFLMATLNLSPREIEGEFSYLEKHEGLPGDLELFEEPVWTIEDFKVDLHDEIVEKYAIMHSIEDFREWIGPWMRFVLDGHTESTGAPADHDLVCNFERACPAFILSSMVEDQMTGGAPSVRRHVEYISLTDEVINMNVWIVKTLEQLGIYTEDEAANLIDDYMWWIESLETEIHYDPALFGLDRSVQTPEELED